MNLYVFECNDTTQSECFARNLFGAKAQWPLRVKKGDYCLLFNYHGHDKLIYGVFEATADGARNHQADAWSGKYPCQVPVKLRSKERISIPRNNLDRFVTDSESGRVRNILVGQLSVETLQYFAGGFAHQVEFGRPVSEAKEDFRFRYLREYHCQDGHSVRSLSEQTIDNWLSSHQVYHEYERLTNLPEHLIPDFTVYDRAKHPVHIEYWGLLDEPDYQQRRQRKNQIYSKYQCNLIELTQEDLKNLDFSLRKKLQEYDVEIK